MKILMLTPYVTIDGSPKFERNKTGFGYMVMDIAKAVGKSEDVDVLATDTRGEELETAGVKFLKRSFSGYLLNLFSCLPLSNLLSLRKHYRMSKRSFIRVAYYWLMTGYLCKLIKKNKYDIVHIHGCGFSTELWMQVCNRCNQKFIVTLHGLNSFSDSVRLSSSGKQYERDFLKRVVEREFPITVISTGMKRLIEKTYGVMDCDNIKVVCNSFNFSSDKGLDLKVRKKYGIPFDAKALLYVGNISINKNQLQMVEAFDLLHEEQRLNTWVLFCGENHMGNDTSFEDAIRKSNSSSHLIVCGGIKKDLMPAYYQAADAIILLSKAEGFGLSLIEGMHYGLPCAMFKDMDAFEDIYSECAVIPIGDRENSTVSNAIEKLLTKQYNKCEIVECSRRFEAQTMANNYKKVYELL